ncbi:hypothetical protein PVAP13_5NG615001 [Panicum virgatum]|uniref:Uncharacterized protein n=1 Tax=Panicum virgatum TaxID=38727 RepID=A0A8T0SAC2_PANVG|nr:hypothetical protein PVAP13_5NG615001 [Panicum virgatum]
MTQYHRATRFCPPLLLAWGDMPSRCGFRPVLRGRHGSGRAAAASSNSAPRCAADSSPMRREDAHVSWTSSGPSPHHQCASRFSFRDARGPRFLFAGAARD